MGRKQTSVPKTQPNGAVPRWPLAKLLLDPNNARFGSVVGKLTEQSDILDHIVETFGVDDVLSSLAVNGYFRAEPLVARAGPGKDVATVVEGNRRLAACLILSGDPRAARQDVKAATFKRTWREHGSPSIDPVPTIVYGADEDKIALLSYLGVRHIAASQPWDSYAKAAWVAEVVERSSLSLREVAQMIGDQHRTIHRMMQGYYFAKQVIDAGIFRPEDSQRRGRGSVTEYPFSWIYTLLGYASAREFFGIPDDISDPKPNPVPNERLQRAGIAVRAMFGDRATGRSSAIEDSRQLGDLASALQDPIKVGYLEQGKSLDDVVRLTQPIETQLGEGLTRIRELLRELLAGLSERPVTGAIAESMVEIAEGNRRILTDIIDKLRKAVGE